MDRWNGWIEGTDGMGGQRGQMDRCEWVDRHEQIDGHKQVDRCEQLDRWDRWDSCEWVDRCEQLDRQNGWTERTDGQM